jgi:hypothetical protein
MFNAMSVNFPILGIGDFKCREFQEAGKWLARRGAANASDIGSGVRKISNEVDPALVIVAQQQPSEFSASDFERLRSAAPLSRIVRLLGPWFEGETRTGRPLPGMPRFYWHQWPRLARQIESLKAGDDSPFMLPSTAGEDERILAPVAPVKIDGSPKRIVIIARFRETADSLADLCATRGWCARWLQGFPRAALSETDAAIVDVLRGDTEDFRTINAFEQLIRPAPILAIVGFPRSSYVEQLCKAGAAAIVSKPYLADDLLWQLERLMAQVAP